MRVMKMSWLVMVAAMLAPGNTASGAGPVPVEMTYQGVLLDGGAPAADGDYDLIFRLYDAETGGQEVWGPLPVTAAVTSGIFTVNLRTRDDVGRILRHAITNSPTFLEIQLGGEPGPLLPRQKLRATPYALYSDLANRVVAASITATALADGSVTTAKIADGTIQSLDIGNQQVRSTNLGNNSVDSAKIRDGTITGADIGSGQVGNSDLANNAVNSAKILDGSITGADIGSSQVGNSDLANNAVNSAKILNNSITASDIGTGAVASSEILDRSVGNSDLANNAVTSAKIADGTITSDDIVPGAISQLGAPDGNPNAAVSVDDFGDVTTTGTFRTTEELSVRGTFTFVPPSSFVTDYPKLTLVTPSLIVGGDVETTIRGENDRVIIEDRLEVDGMRTGSGTTVVRNSSGELLRSTSSRRYKTGIVPMQDNPERILELQAKEYVRKDTKQREVGYIAEEVDEAGLTLVTVYDEQGRPDAVDYQRMVVYANEILKRQRLRIQSLETEVAELRELIQAVAKDARRGVSPEGK